MDGRVTWVCREATRLVLGREEDMEGGREEWRGDKAQWRRCCDTIRAVAIMQNDGVHVRGCGLDDMMAIRLELYHSSTWSA